MKIIANATVLLVEKKIQTGDAFARTLVKLSITTRLLDSSVNPKLAIKMTVLPLRMAEGRGIPLHADVIARRVWVGLGLNVLKRTRLVMRFGIRLLLFKVRTI
jgi:hypothetical protein